MTHPIKRPWFAPLGLAALVALPGCVVATSEPVILERTGYLTVEWSLEGTLDPGLCSFYVVDALELVVYDDLGNYVTEVETPCEAFTVTLELYPGVYDADATLVGFRDEAATTTEPLVGLRILADSELVVSVDYPPRSFL